MCESHPLPFLRKSQHPPEEDQASRTPAFGGHFRRRAGQHSLQDPSVSLCLHLNLLSTSADTVVFIHLTWLVTHPLLESQGLRTLGALLLLQEQLTPRHTVGLHDCALQCEREESQMALGCRSDLLQPLVVEVTCCRPPQYGAVLPASLIIVFSSAHALAARAQPGEEAHLLTSFQVAGRK